MTDKLIDCGTFSRSSIIALNKLCKADLLTQQIDLALQHKKWFRNSNGQNNHTFRPRGKKLFVKASVSST